MLTEMIDVSDVFFCFFCMQDFLQNFYTFYKRFYSLFYKKNHLNFFVE